MMTQASAPQALGYVGVRAKDLGDWASYGSGLLGLQRVDQSRSTLAFRMDDRKQRLIVDADGGEGIGFFDWEAADAGVLDALAARLENKAIEVAHGTRALADERRVKGLVVLRDPVGNRLEIFHGAETATEPFQPGRSISGFRTGPLGLGHVVLTADKPDTIDRLTTFYCDLLGFRLTDYYFEPFVSAVSAHQSAPSQPCLHSDRRKCRPSPDDGAFQLRRCGPGVRPGARRRTPRCGHAWPAHERLHHLVLYLHAFELHG